MSEKILDTILTEIVNIKETMKNLATKDELVQTKNEILGEVDSFVKLHTKLDHEVTALRSKYSRLEDRLTTVEDKI